MDLSIGIPGRKIDIYNGDVYLLSYLVEEGDKRENSLLLADIHEYLIHAHDFPCDLDLRWRQGEEDTIEVIYDVVFQDYKKRKRGEF